MMTWKKTQKRKVNKQKRKGTAMKEFKLNWWEWVLFVGNLGVSIGGIYMIVTL